MHGMKKHFILLVANNWNAAAFKNCEIIQLMWYKIYYESLKNYFEVNIKKLTLIFKNDNNCLTLSVFRSTLTYPDLTHTHRIKAIRLYKRLYGCIYYWMRTNSYPVALLKVAAVFSEGWLPALSQQHFGANVSVKGGPAAKRHFTERRGQAQHRQRG